MGNLKPLDEVSGDPPASGSTLGPGSRIGSWEILRVLGQGAQGLVCAARGSDGAAATLKLPRDFGSARAGEADELLEREAEVLGRIDHPNVARASGLTHIDDRAVLQLEPVEGESLAARLDRHRGGEAEAAFDDAALTALLRGLAAGLEAVHEAGYLHGDVKPANIFLRPDGTPLLVDFGAAEARDGAPRGEIGHATAGYAPIEQYDSGGQEGPWTDLYGLAAVGYRIVAGRPPTPAPSRAAGEPLLSAARAGKGRFAASLLDAIDEGLALKPTRRARSLADWLASLDRPAGMSPDGTDPDEETPGESEFVVPETSDASSAPSTVSGNLPVSPAEPLPDASSPVATPFDDLPPTEKVTRLPISLRGGEAPTTAASFGSRRAATLRAERRERSGAETTAPRRSRLGFLGLAVVLAALAFGGWEGYLRFVKSEWRIDPAGGADATSVHQALLRARDGAKLYLAPGLYPETVILQSAVDLIGPEDPETPAVIEPPEGPCLLSAAPGASVSRLVLIRPAAAEGVAGTAAVEDGGPCVVIMNSLRVEDSSVTSAAGPAVVIRDGADPALTRVSVGESAGAGIIVEGGAGGSIVESQIAKSAKAGILVREDAAPTVTGSRIEGSGQAGILVANGGGGLFEGNEIADSEASAIELREGANPELRGNLLSGSKQAGLYIYDGAKGLIAENRIIDNAFSGVIVAGEAAPELRGNEIAGNGEHGIAVLEGGGGRIEDNRIADNKGHGIVQADGSPAVLGRNQLSGNRRPQLQVGRQPSSR